MTKEPYIHTKVSSLSINRDIFIALIPAAVMSVYIIGIKSLWIMLLAAATSVSAGLVLDIIFKQDKASGVFRSLGDALITAFLLPTSAALWLAPIAALLTTAVFDRILGHTRRFICPSVGSMFVLMLIFGILPERISICASAAPAVALGFIYLVIRKVYRQQISVSFILAYLAAAFIAPLFTGAQANPLIQLTDGVLILCAGFIAPSYGSSPIRPSRQILFGVCAGVITLLFNIILPLTQSALITMLIMSPIAAIFDAV